VESDFDRSVWLRYCWGSGVKFSSRVFALTGGVLLLGCLATSAEANIVVLNAINSGLYQSNGVSSGAYSGYAQENGALNDWLGFNLSSVDGTITGATLELYNDASAYGADQSTVWWDVTTPYSELGVVNSTAIFQDLGSGVVFGNGIANAGSINDFTLNAAAIASLNATSGDWAIGGTDTSSGYSFLFTNGVSTPGVTLELVLNVTPPAVPDSGSALALLGLGLGALALLKRKQGREGR